MGAIFAVSRLHKLTMISTSAVSRLHKLIPVYSFYSYWRIQGLRDFIDEENSILSFLLDNSDIMMIWENCISDTAQWGVAKLCNFFKWLLITKNAVTKFA